MNDGNQIRFSRLILNSGNKSFLEIQTLLIIVAPLSVIGSIAASTVQKPSDIAIWLIANIAALAILALPVWAFRFSRANKPWKQIQIVTVVLISALLGVAKSLLTLGFVYLFSAGSLQIPDPFVSASSAALLSTPLIIFASVFVTLRREFKKDRDLLITAKGLQQMRKNTKGLEEKLYDLAENLRKLAKKLQEKEISELGAMEMRLIRALVDKQVRPLATSVFENLEKSIQSFRFEKLWATSMQTRPQAFLISAPLMLNIFQVSEVFGPLRATGSLILITMISTAVISVSASFFERVNFQNSFSYYLSSVLGPVIAVAPFVFFTQLRPELTAIMTVLLISSILFSTLFGVIRVALSFGVENREAVNRLLESDPNLEFASLARKSKDVANQIHGEVQSRLMNIVLQSQAGESVNRARATEELINIASLLEKSTPESPSFEQFMDNLQKTWSGFTSITHTVSTANLSPEKLEELQPVIEEGITNAFKHGMATAVDVSLECDRLVITDNGIGPTKGNFGLGSKILDAASKNWRLKPGPEGGSELIVEF